MSVILLSAPYAECCYAVCRATRPSYTQFYTRLLMFTINKALAYYGRVFLGGGGAGGGAKESLL